MKSRQLVLVHLGRDWPVQLSDNIPIIMAGIFRHYITFQTYSGRIEKESRFVVLVTTNPCPYPLDACHCRHFVLKTKRKEKHPE